MSYEPKLVVTGRVLSPCDGFKKRNPHLFPQAGGAGAGGLASPERKSDPVRALVTRPKVQRGGKGRLAVCVTIIALKRRFIDDDNIAAGAKALRDAIATSLGIDDADKRVRWQYGFAQTAGPDQTIVHITTK